MAGTLVGQKGFSWVNLLLQRSLREDIALPKKELEKKLKRVVQKRNHSEEGNIKVEVSGRCLFKRHCGMPMIKVNVFCVLRKYKNLKKPPIKLNKEFICSNPECSYHTTARGLFC